MLVEDVTEDGSGNDWKVEDGDGDGIGTWYQDILSGHERMETRGIFEEETRDG